MQPKEALYQVIADHLCAGFIVRHGWVAETAPILNRMKGHTVSYIKKYCARKGWKCQLVGIN